MNKISFELEPNYLSKLTEFANGTNINNKAKEIVVNYLNSVTVKSEVPKAKPLDRRKFGI